MGSNVSGWRTDAPNQVGYRVRYQFWTAGQAMGAQLGQAKREGAVVDGTRNWSLASYNHNIYLDVAPQRIGYSFLVGSTSGQELGVILCGEGLG
jgi:hypothetical protein